MTATTTKEFRKLLDSLEMSIRFDAGVCMPASSVNISQREEIVQSLIKHYVFHVAKAELDQLKAGLSLLGVHNLMMENRCLFKPLLVASGKPAFSLGNVQYLLVSSRFQST